MSSPSLYTAIDCPDGRFVNIEIEEGGFYNLLYALPTRNGKALRDLFAGTAIEPDFLNVCEHSESLTWGGELAIESDLGGYTKAKPLPPGSRLLFFFVGY